MATWVRNDVAGQSATNADVVGTVELDNATAPADFDPDAVNSVRVQYTTQIQSGTFQSGGAENHAVHEKFDLTLNGIGTVVAAFDGVGGVLDDGTVNSSPIACDEIDNTIATGYTNAQWEAMELNDSHGTGGWTEFNQNKGADGVAVEVLTFTVTIDYTPDLAQTVVLGTASEVDTAGVHIAIFDQTVVLGTASEVDTANAHTASGAAVAMTQTSFRIRSADDTALNTDSGWAAAKGADASLAVADLEFRIRFLLSAGASVTDTYELWYSKDAGAYAVVPNLSDPWVATNVDAQPEVGLVPSAQYTEGAATTELLAGAGTFVAGEGRESEPTGSIVLVSGEDTEIEFAILVRKLGNDGHIPDGTTLDFQVRYAAGTVLEAYTDTPRVTIANRAGQIGGAFAESSMRTIVADDAGNIYAAMEYTDHSTGTYVNELVMMKSTDGGDSWNPIDEAGRPGSSLNDIESLDMIYSARDDLIHVAWCAGDAPYYTTFNTAGHATPDEWSLTPELIVTVGAVAYQGVTLLVRESDDAIFAFFKDNDGTYETLEYAERTAVNTWGTPVEVDNEADHIEKAGIVIDSNNVGHIFYAIQRGGATTGDLYHRTLNTSDVLSARTLVNDVATDLEGAQTGAQQPFTMPRIWFDGATEKVAILFVDETDDLYFTASDVSTISFSADQGPVQVDTSYVFANGGGSGQLTAGFVIDENDSDAMYVWFAMGNAKNVMLYNKRTAGTWAGSDTTFWTAEKALDEWNTIRIAQFTHSVGNGGATVAGILADRHEGPGGTGGMAYKEFTLAPPAQTVILGTASEVDTAGVHSASTGTSPQTVILGTASEVDTAGVHATVAGNVDVVLGTASEVDTAGVHAAASSGAPQTVILGTASETDTAGVHSAAGGNVTVVIGTASEVDTANAHSAVGGNVTVILGTASEVDTASVHAANPGVVTVILGTASEVDTAGVHDASTPAGGQTVVLGTASEVDTAGVHAANPGNVTVVLGTASEVDTAGVHAVTSAITVVLGTASEVDTANAHAATPGNVDVVLGTASEVDTAGIHAASTPVAQTVILGTASETDTAGAHVANPGNVDVVLGTASEVDTANAHGATAGNFTVVLGTASEVDTAGVHAASTPAGSQTVVLGTASEVDTAGIHTASIASAPQTVVLGTASETDTAGVHATAAGNVTVVLGTASEVDTAGAHAANPGNFTVTLGTATEVDTAGTHDAAPGNVTVVLATASEVDTAGVHAAFFDQTVILGTATEVDTAGVHTALFGVVGDGGLILLYEMVI